MSTTIDLDNEPNSVRFTAFVGPNKQLMAQVSVSADQWAQIPAEHLDELAARWIRHRGGRIGGVIVDGWRIAAGAKLPSEIHGALWPILLLTHRCGFEVWLDQRAYLPDVINGPVAGHHRDGCGS